MRISYSPTVTLGNLLIAFPALLAVLGLAYQLGIGQSKLDDLVSAKLPARMAVVEQKAAANDIAIKSTQQDIIARLNRIEDKVDRMQQEHR